MHTLKTLALCAAMALGGTAYAAGTGMTKADHNAKKDQIEADYKADKAACDKMEGNAKDVCTEKAKSKEKVAKAELEYNYTGKASDMQKVAMAKADGDYAVAKEMCEDKKGNDKDVCDKQAKADHEKAKADAKMAKKNGETRKDAMKDKRDADYAVATEKCDALSGNAKDNCVRDAKARFGKN